jgi:DNA polymerase V
MNISKILTDNTVLLHFSDSAPCSFPARPVNDDIETEIHFSKYWVPNSKDSYSVIATGDSMIEARIFEGDMLVIDCSVEPKHGNIVAASVNGDLTIKRLQLTEEGFPILKAENPNYLPLAIAENDDFRVLGVITSVHRRLL